jgi:hypothetical protein
MASISDDGGSRPKSNTMFKESDGVSHQHRGFMPRGNSSSPRKKGITSAKNH